VGDSVAIHRYRSGRKIPRDSPRSQLIAQVSPFDNAQNSTQVVLTIAFAKDRLLVQSRVTEPCHERSIEPWCSRSVLRPKTDASGENTIEEFYWCMAAMLLQHTAISSGGVIVQIDTSDRHIRPIYQAPEQRQRRLIIGLVKGSVEPGHPLDFSGFRR
jgi:hypothetical protein